MNAELTFSAGIRNICRNISILNDGFYEDDEDFTVSLSTSDPSVTIDAARDSGAALIMDDDGKMW